MAFFKRQKKSLFHAKILSALNFVSSLLTLALTSLLFAFLITKQDPTQSRPEVKIMTSTAAESKVKELPPWIHNSSEFRRFTLFNSDGFEVDVTSLGASITAIRLNGVDLALGYDKPDAYLAPENNPYFGATVGRVANRINGGRFSIDGKNYSLAANNGPNHLHGGVTGFNRRNWKVTAVDGTGVTFALLSPDRDEGYPGNLIVTAEFTIEERNALKIRYRGFADDKTPVNLANHVYLNLAGHDSGESGLLRHEVRINADGFTPVDSTLIPIGEVEPVEGTRFDLRRRGKMTPGFDHNFALNDPDLTEIAAEVWDPVSGRNLKVRTDQPGLQFYTGNFLGGQRGKEGVVYEKHGGFCMETQLFPDAVNQRFRLNSVLNPGQLYRHDVVYQFGVNK